MVELSIIIPTLNEAHYLPILLDSIKRQTYRDYEIIISDGSSKDNTVEVARKYGCRIIIDKKNGPGYGRNRGAEAAQGKYLLFLDSDVFFPSRDFLEQLMSGAKRRRIRLGTCLVKPYPARPVDLMLSPLTNAYIIASAGISPFALGFFIFASRAIHRKIGGFDETILIGEDGNYARRAAKHAKFHVVTKLKIYYSTRRLEKEGRLSLYPKCLLMSIYQGLVGEINKPLFGYEFGDYKPPQNSYDEILKEIGANKYADGAPVRKILERLREMGKGAGKRKGKKKRSKGKFGRRRRAA